MIRRLLLLLGDTCTRSLPGEWREAARAEAEHIGGTGELARWTLGLLRLALPRWKVLPAVLSGARIRRLR